MTIYRNFNDVSDDFAACIGFFDGVHRGHQFLLQHLRDEAARHGLKSAVVTFVNHPRKLIQPDYDLLLIDSLEERMEKLAATGIDACFLMEFTEDVRRLTARQFIQDILATQMHVRLLIIGYDHRFGRDRSEGFDDYVRYGRECGMEVIQEPVFSDDSGLHFSSSEVRRALQAGDVAKAHRILGDGK
ncbi:MAG: FAD synthetase family protein [Bacteroidales bacterium]|nr:FAD synthetase family protein [Bacteroidales bacterium]